MAADAHESWSVHEIELFSGEQRITPGRRWQLDAWPNVWESTYAFDQNPLSRWSTWEDQKAGMFIEAEFDAPLSVSRVDVVRLDNEHSADPEVFLQKQDGSWGQAPAQLYPYSRLNLRSNAVRLLKRAGFRYVLVRVSKADNGPIGVDMVSRPGDWGVTIAANQDSAYLIRLPD